MTMAQILHCFTQQEKLAIPRQDENKRTQRPASKQVKTRTNVQDVQEEVDPRDHSKPSSFKKTTPAAVLDADPCPVHNHPHTWGACHSNHFTEHCQEQFHQDQSKKDDDTKKPAKTGTDQFMVHTSIDKMDAASSTDESVLNDEDLNNESDK
jgi:hypothetical protein